MTKQEFDRIVAESVKAGAGRAEAEEYVVSGFKLPVDKNGKPEFESGQSSQSGKSGKKKPASRTS